ncbi:MAG: hypothetical protein IT204_06225 [Fimbriimonadaceae bacterium]|nr:hypothetical protein [Fimbriimonadaceae bacterium]
MRTLGWLAWLLVCLPVAAEPLPRLGVGGVLRMGLGGVLLRAGLPFDYLSAAEQGDPTVLRRYDAVLQAPIWSDEEGYQTAANRALDQYLRQGGQVYAALQSFPPAALAGLSFSSHSTGHPPSCSGWPFELVAGDHPLLKLLPPQRRWDYGYTLFALQPTPQDTVLARFPTFGAAALVERRVGAGRLLYSGFDVAYLQGNWAPWYEDLLLALANCLTAGRAVPQWHPVEPVAAPAAPAPPAPTFPAAAGQQLLAAAAEPYTVARLPRVGGGRGLLRIGARPGSLAGLLLTLAGAQVTVAASPAGRPLTPAAVALPGDEPPLLLLWPDRCELVLAGRVLARWPGQWRGPVTWQGPGEPEWQTNADGLFAADFAAEGQLSADWRVLGGTWRLTGRGEGKGQPGFALRGSDGALAAGDWFWAGPRLQLAVRPREATAVRVQLCRDALGNALEAEVAVDRGSTRLLRRHGPQVTVLATTARVIPARQWTRLEVRADYQLSKLLVDGDLWLQAADPGPQCGGLTLGVAGEASFDDLRLTCGDNTWPTPAVHDPSFDKGPEGLLDRDTWAHPAAAWEPDAGSRQQWLVGRLAADLTLRLTPTAWRAGGQLTVLAGAQRGQSPPLAVWDRPTASAVVRRRAGRWSVDPPGRLLAQPVGSVCLGLAWQQLDLAAAAVRLTAAEVCETTFDKAPVDWREAGGRWVVASRWTCEPEWAWLTGDGRQGRAVLWHKWPLLGPQVVQAYLGVQMTGSYGSAAVEPVERLRLTLAGDGQDPWQGYVLEVGADGPDARLLRHGVEVTRVERIVPHWREMHNAWAEVRVERVGARLTAWLHHRPLLTWTDPQPLPDGQVAVWTERNNLVVPYLALYGRRGPRPGG